MNLPPLLLASIGLAGVFSGRLLFNRWFNHLSLYSLIWGTGLALFELRLIDYTPMTAEVWMMIGYAWIAFTVGSMILILARAAVGDSLNAPVVASALRMTIGEKRLFSFFIVVLSSIAMLTILYQWSVLINRFGSITEVLLSGRIIYRLTVTGKLPGKIPYVDSLSLAAACLAGLYSARSGKVKLLALFPLSCSIMADVARGGRAKILLTGMLFFGAYFLARNTLAQSRILQPMSKVRRLLALGVVLAILLIAVEFVRGYRGVYERFYGTSTQLSKLERSAFVTPSIYLYFSSQVGVFNAYWKAGGENPFPGSNTFAPLFRILAKLGIADDVPYFQKFYNVPIYTNTGTYLRELHADFGVVGIIAAPYLLGFFCTYFWFRVKRQSKFVSIALLTHLYMIVLCSFLFQVTRLGEWVVSLIASLVICYFIDRQGYIEEPGKNNDPT